MVLLFYFFLFLTLVDVVAFLVFVVATRLRLVEVDFFLTGAFLICLIFFFLGSFPVFVAVFFFFPLLDEDEEEEEEEEEEEPPPPFLINADLTK